MRSFRLSLYLIALSVPVRALGVAPDCGSLAWKGNLRGETQVFLQKLLAKDIAPEQFEKIVHDAANAGVTKVRISTSILKQVDVPARPDPSKPPPDHMKRYGQEGNPIFAHVMHGEVGKPGGVYIYTPGEKVPPTQFDQFLGPLHVHPGVSHFSMVAKGKGLFFMEVEVAGKRVLQKFEASEGDAFFIPADRVHTFWAGNNGAFDVLAFSSVVVPTNAANFQRTMSEAEVRGLGIE